jgi:hypothetical protein
MDLVLVFDAIPQLFLPDNKTRLSTFLVQCSGTRSLAQQYPTVLLAHHDAEVPYVIFWVARPASRFVTVTVTCTAGLVCVCVRYSSTIPPAPPPCDKRVTVVSRESKRSVVSSNQRKPILQIVGLARLVGCTWYVLAGS